jgi:osmotically-inducible protein OsmY
VDTEAIAVSAKDGAVTLRGTVGSPRKKREAQKAAQRVHGVRCVDNQLEVQILDDQRRADADLRADVLQALALDTEVPATVDAAVDNGVVTLTGTATWQFQRDEAESVAEKARGVTHVHNDIALTDNRLEAGDVRPFIEWAMQRAAQLDARKVTVETRDGAVTLTGSVSSWAEHDAAVDVAWASPGVTAVHDCLDVRY